MIFNHKTVLLNETLKFLNLTPNGVYVDGTLGGGGFSQAIVKNLFKCGKIIAIDCDPDAIENCKRIFKNNENIVLFQSNFVNILEILHDLNIEKIDGAILDLGVSSYQLDTTKRGFSYNKDAPLDMRMSKSGLTAGEVVNTFKREKIFEILKNYGEERNARKIANAIIAAREKCLIKTTLQLAEIIKFAVPYCTGGHFAKKTFQAIRIFINSELENLNIGLDNFFSILKKNGRICVISFHSLEDRIVKNKMCSWRKNCCCPSEFPVCVCKKKSKAIILTKKPVTPCEIEIKNNPRSRSAKLRVCEKTV